MTQTSMLDYLIVDNFAGGGGASYPCEDGGGEECTVDNKKPLTRPPQSWCYVEEI